MAVFAVSVDSVGSMLSPIVLLMLSGNVRKWLPLVPLLLLLPAIPHPVDSFQINVDPSSNTGAYQPHKTTKKLFPYQEHGVERLLDRKRLLLADEMGLGKTIQCIEALNRIGREDSIILVICPKSVLGVWQSELEEWLAPHLAASWAIHIASTKDKPVPRPGTITLLNYDITWKLEEELQSPNYDVLICDECHYLKSLDSKRTKTILGDLTRKRPIPGIRADYMWLLTGTPILNRPVELFSLLHAIDPVEFPDFDEYANRYCDPKTRTVFQSRGRAVTIKDYSGASNLEELSKRLEAIMLRRYKMDVLSQLPPKFRSCICLAGGEDIALQERELLRAALEDSNITESVTGGMDLDDFGSSAEKLMSYLQRGRSDSEILAKISAVRQETALRKLKPSFELLDEYIIQEKVVVFVHHRAVYDAVMEHFGDQAVGIKGGMDREDRDEAVRRFQNDPNVRVFVGSIRAAGLGLTLTASSHVVFLELDWSPGVMSQAEDRCHRVGQLNSVRIQYFVFKDTIDAWLSKSLMFKQSSISRILPEKLSGADGTGYVFNFGKHEGTRLEDVPRAYVEFLLKRGAWRNRPGLWRALHGMGLVSEEPPPKIDHQMIQSSSTPQNRPTMRSIATETSNSGELKLDHQEIPPQSLISPNPHQTSNNRIALGRNQDLKLDHQTMQPQSTAHQLTPTFNNEIEVIRKDELKLGHEKLQAPPQNISKNRAEASSKEGLKVDYTFNFGMHNGKAWDAVPEGYREWILEKKVYGSKGRESLLVALVQAGFDPNQ